MAGCSIYLGINPLSDVWVTNLFALSRFFFSLLLLLCRKVPAWWNRRSSFEGFVFLFLFFYFLLCFRRWYLNLFALCHCDKSNFVTKALTKSNFETEWVYLQRIPSTIEGWQCRDGRSGLLAFPHVTLTKEPRKHSRSHEGCGWLDNLLIC